ncbi:YggT family protein [Nocardia sp. NEAU-G5]|jgi:YggT family protein|uniref:YggT family protein n=1 Tax=Nocardia albiluteola TaxID=2842303 RepID=A0ABS6B643_9NOCA|nr:YggT family protein [Nocardia albiluteola]MBU3065780.1 YggT family protein [Nocardia albiluteola]
MALIGAVIGYALSLFILALLARMVLDWIQMLSSSPSAEWLVKGRRIAHACTEPVIAPVRKVLPPVRAGGMSIDLAFTLVFILALILRSIAFSL